MALALHVVVTGASGYVGKRFCRDHCRHARVLGGFLQRNGRPERCAEQDHRTWPDCVEHAMKIQLLKKPVRAYFTR